VKYHSRRIIDNNKQLKDEKTNKEYFKINRKMMMKIID
jgi:hypothetical protein